MMYREVWDVCNECNDAIYEEDEYIMAIHPFTDKELYIHESCREAFIDRNEMGFCDLCDRLTNVTGYHEDAEFSTDVETGNHVMCEDDYAKRNDYGLRECG